MIKKVLHKNRNRINGIVQVGANIGQEIELFIKYSKNIYLFEPLASAHQVLERIIAKNQYIKLYKFALGQKEEVKILNVSNQNYRASSSFLEPSLHLDYFPEIEFNEVQEVEVKRFDQLEDEFKANFLILDVQGFELNVIKGMGQKIINFDFIFTEFSMKELYKDSVLINELDKELLNLGFVRTNTKIASNKPHGDAFYKKKDDLFLLNILYYQNKSKFQLTKIYLIFNFFSDYKKIFFLFKKFIKKTLNK